MRISLPRALALAPIAASLLAASGCLRDPNADANTAEALTAVGDEITSLRQQQGDLQNQVDSLRAIVARQDTLTRRLAGMAGVPVP